MTHTRDDEDARHAELLRDYIDDHSPEDSARAFDRARDRAKAPPPWRAFVAGVATCTLAMAAMYMVVTLTDRPHTSQPEEGSSSLATPAQTETYGETPRGWHFIPSKGLQCEVGVSYSEAYKGETSSILRSDEQDGDSFCALSQSITATKYVGKRVRFSAWVKSQDVAHHAGLWMRVDGQQGRVLAFDNMSDRPIRSTRDWQRYAVVLDIPEEAHHIVYGALLSGLGKIFWDEANLEVVEDAIPTTSIMRDEPHNTSFEQ